MISKLAGGTLGAFVALFSAGDVSYSPDTQERTRSKGAHVEKHGHAEVRSTAVSATKIPNARADQRSVDAILAEWPAKPKAVAYMTIKKYGLPQEASASQLVWRANGPWKRTIVNRKEIPHHFPKLHTDVMEQVIDYRVHPERFDDLAAFDGSVIAERTAGELSARCDMEGANFLALNLAHDVVTGEKTPAEARKAYEQDIVAMMTGPAPPPTVTGLRFRHSRAAAGDPDEVTIEGATRPVAQGERQLVSGREVVDAEVLGVLVAENTNEVMAASFALQTTKNAGVKRYAARLKKEHGAALKATMQVGPRIDVVPVAGPLVKQIDEHAAEATAKLAQRDGAEFDRAYVDTMVEHHEQTLAMIDSKLLPRAKNEAVKRQLTETRRLVASHLQEGKRLQVGR